jgi:hypothetical protein
MARPLRVEYPGAYYHVINRGDNQEKILKTTGTEKSFSNTLKKRDERL